MNFFKINFIILIIVTFNYANVIKPKILHNSVKNANTVLLELESKTISDVKLTLENMNIPFYKNPFKENNFYALVPISYYSKFKNKKIIISYLEKNERIFTSVKVDILDGKYESEIIKVKKSKVTINKKDKKRTTKEYSEAMKIYNMKSDDLQWNEDFIQPIESSVTSNFGTKRVYNNKLKSYHTGIDFKASIGTEILASNSGIVKLSSNRFYAGNSVVIDHGHGVFTCYFHLSKIFVKENEKVKKSQIVGLSGNSGRVTGPHLHFAARVHGVQVNPSQLIEILNVLNN